MKNSLHTSNRLHNGRPLAVAMVLLCLAMPAKPAVANVADCQTYTEFDDFTAAKREYRINLGEFSLISGVSLTEGWLATVQAADMWNENTNFGYFEYIGDTVVEDLPEFYSASECSASLVIVKPKSSGTELRGKARPRCIFWGIPTQFQVEIYATNEFGVPFSYAVGDAVANKTDLVGLLTHELGHTLGLAHTRSFPTQYSIMYAPYIGGPIGWDDDLTRRRDPYELDFECLQDPAESYVPRELQLDYFLFYNGLVYGPYLLSGWPMADGSALLTKTTGSWSFGYSGARSDDGSYTECPVWARGTGISNGNCIPSMPTPAGTGPSPTVWKEDDTGGPVPDRVFYSEVDDHPTDYHWDSEHITRQTRSYDGFQTDSLWNMYHCATMSSWMTCSSYSNIFSPRALAFAWDDYNDVTLTVWTHHNREDDDTNREVFVAAGVINDWLVPQPTSLGFRSKVTPGVACKQFTVGPNQSYDCMVAYVDDDSADSQISVRYMYHSSNGTRYSAKLSLTTATLSDLSGYVPVTSSGLQPGTTVASSGSRSVLPGPGRRSRCSPRRMQ